jgi:hypothetical protein
MLVAMKKGVLSITAAALAALITASSGAGSGGTVTRGVKALLDARQEVPAQTVKRPAARGVLTGTLVVNGTRGKLVWQLGFTGLSGKAVLAHVHLGQYGKAGPIGFLLCRPCRAGMHGTTSVPRKVVNAIVNGGAYVDVHTKKNPRGEIRGQLRMITGA